MRQRRKNVRRLDRDAARRDEHSQGLKQNAKISKLKKCLHHTHSRARGAAARGVMYYYLVGGIHFFFACVCVFFIFHRRVDISFIVFGLTFFFNRMWFGRAP